MMPGVSRGGAAAGWDRERRPKLAGAVGRGCVWVLSRGIEACEREGGVGAR